MVFKLLLASEKRWRTLNAPHLVALVKSGVQFPNGQAKMLEAEPARESLFMPTPWMPATSDVPIHNSWRYLQNPISYRLGLCQPAIGSSTTSD
jgi:hypothetical protein